MNVDDTDDEFNQPFTGQLEPTDQLHPAEPEPSKAMPMGVEPATINRGDVFWIRPDNPNAAELGYYPHPYVVIQDDLFNHSRITTVVVCALTTNLKQASAPGNLLLEAGEANLPRQSVVVVSKISTAHKSQLAEYIGSLDQQRVNQILAGIRFLQSSFFA